MKEPVKNIAASILARLRKQADEMNRPFAEILQYYAMERFLYRLSKTKYAGKFVLKGGLLFYVWDLPMRRPTRDIDFRGYVSGDRENLLKIVTAVMEVSAPEDGLVFDPKSVSAEETQLEADYRGVRVRLIAMLERTRIPVQIDIGFSDELTSKAEAIEYPNILPGLKTVHMKGYPKESVVAEKFHAMTRFGDLNSRLKDFYDLWLMSATFEFDSLSLQKALETTFKNRDTVLPAERPISLTAEFASRNQTHWANFLKRMELANQDNDNFSDVVEQVWEFIWPPLQAILSKTRSAQKWTPEKGWK
ncbi:MAG: nucleotidyl transferase AbiEii/AbiGii toxin family protein [Chloroflexi bacterium]|nr:nucleotidyl transferase AbiEii/AbiGii toxin family protein [Chloroflexota bacterium]